ncbi:hypothetical protein QAD02_001720 [Eretmocerus hayati]|uniref:Uncharacterized protein n=1 Tax=Eretmocerus hayati TaxID=131215 RepID=A0ACC2NH95_9HYME|nr:hypothetical protein QAD02_001720 [Eretmocerus hayati]
MNLSDDESDYDEEKETVCVRNLEAEGALLAQNLLPTKSRRIYELAYAAFLKWHQDNQSQPITENLLLAYFQELSHTYSPPTLWSNKAYKAKEAAVFQWIHIETFLRDADDYYYLIMKVVSIMGICGAMRCDEMTKLQTSDVKDMSPPNQTLNENNKKKFYYYVSIVDTKTYVPRTFVVGDIFYPILKKYVDLRQPIVAKDSRFFLFYSKRRCTKQPIGKNRFGDISKDIAGYLGLKNANDYTGHSYRRTAATLLSNSGANLAAVKALGGWLSDTTPQGYIEHSDHNRMQIFEGIVSANESLTAVPSSNSSPQPQLVPAKLFNFKTPLRTANARSSTKPTTSGSNGDQCGPELISAHKVLSSTSKRRGTCTITSGSLSVANSLASDTNLQGTSTTSVTSPLVPTTVTAHSENETTSKRSAHPNPSNILTAVQNNSLCGNEEFLDPGYLSEVFSEPMEPSSDSTNETSENQLIGNQTKKRKTICSNDKQPSNSIHDENYQSLDIESSFVQFQNCTIHNLTINKYVNPKVA